MNTTIIFFCLLLGIGTSTWVKADEIIKENHLDVNEPWKDEDREDNIECTSIFQPVGGHCLFVDESISLPWQSTRDVCVGMGGHLPNLKDANYLADIKDFVNEYHPDNVSYWVGSHDQATEGEWRWVDDDSFVKMGTPLWGDLLDNIQQPTGGDLENCGLLLHVDHYYMHDEDCNASHSLLCEQFHQESTEEVMAKHATTTWISNNEPNTYSSAECPFPYEMVHGKCIFINTLATKSWYDHKTDCEGLGGHMLKVDDANFLGAIYDHLMETGLDDRWFWIGATDEEQEGDWRWHDNTEVRLGTPFWGDNYGEYNQQPNGGSGQNCAAIASQYHSFFGDGSCDTNLFYVICQMDII